MVELGARLRGRLDRLRANYWLVPAIMLVGAIGLSLLTQALEPLLPNSWLRDVGWLYLNQPEGAREVLSTVAGSAIGVVGVTFSMTILAVSFASGRFGPRLLGNLMRDRGNQVTLGTFTATFMYCLMVLRTVRSDGGEGSADAFVPHVGVLCALLLAIVSVGLLIYFFHHVPESIHISNIVGEVGDDLVRRVRSLMPAASEAGLSVDASPEVDRLAQRVSEDAAPVRAPRAGYLTQVDVPTVVRLAGKHDLLVAMIHRPGDYLHEGAPLLRVHPRSRLDEPLERSLLRAYAFGRQRTPTQDVLFLASELVEVACRALSPGINDPFTALAAIDRLQTGLIEIGRRGEGPALARDDAGHPRVLLSRVVYLDVIEATIDRLIPYVIEDRNATLHLLKVLIQVASVEPAEARRRLLVMRGEALTAAAAPHLAVVADRERAMELLRRLQQLHVDGALREALAAGTTLPERSGG